jgi:hypothetical protein
MNLYRITALLLAIGFLGHTLGGMIGTARRGPGAGADADAVLASMRSVHFRWRNADCTWYAFWMGNGLSASALLLLGVAVLWFLGGAAPGERYALLPLAWAAFASLTLLAIVCVKYFPARIAAVFGLIALLSGAAALSWTM